MSDQPTEIEQKMIEFATKTALTVMGEQNETFKNAFVTRIELVSDQLSDRPVDQFTKEYFEELVLFRGSLPLLHCRGDRG